MAIQTTLEFAHAFLAISDYQGSHFDYPCSHIDYQGGHDNYWPPMTTPNLVKMTTFSFQCMNESKWQLSTTDTDTNNYNTTIIMVTNKIDIILLFPRR